MARVIPARECPQCSGKGHNPAPVYMHMSRLVSVITGETTRIDELCPRCRWMRTSTPEGRIYAEGRRKAAEVAA